jgi:hypothetical protein
MATTHSGSRSSKGATFLFLLGLALVGLGAAFAYAPKFSWQLAKIAEQASALGLQNGALVVGGLVVLGLGVVARVASPAAPATDTREELEGLQAELHLQNEQLSTKLGQLRTALLQVQESVAGLSAQQLALLQAQGETAHPQDQSQDAVFRLAASLDKLHAHFDERVHAIDLQLRNGFETLLAAGQRGAHVEAHHASIPAPLPAHGPHGSHGSHGSHGHAYEAPQPEPGIDFYQTMQKLDAIAGELDAQVDPSQPQAPFPSHGVDALDALLPEEYRDRY